jgi:hypothetical protein
MKFAACVFGCILAVCLIPPSFSQSDIPSKTVPPFWCGFEIGAGQINLNSDQQKGTFDTRVAMGFAGRYQPVNWMRVGLHLNGWLLQASDLYNPAVGETVANFGAVVAMHPVRRARSFLRGGFGRGMYGNERPASTEGDGPAWEVGCGFDFIPLKGNGRMAPMIGYSSGTLGKGSPTFPPQTGLNYSVLEFKLVAVGGLGRRRK